MKKVLMTSFAVCNMLAAFAQSSDADTTEQPLPVKISGSADVYYKYAFNGRDPLNNRTSFTNSHNSFELGMISLKAEHSFKKGSIVADLGFGKRASEFSYNEALNDEKIDKMSVAVKQLYVSYQIIDQIKVSMGSFATHVGYEVVDAYLNRNYSMSYMFSYGPFFSTGVKADFTISPSVTAMVGVFNPTDFKSASWSNPKYIGAQLGFAPTGTPLKLYLNYLEGRDTAGIQNHQVDLVATYQVNSVLGLGYNGTFSTYSDTRAKDGSDSKKWWGSALYVNLDFNEKLGLTLRGEYFDDKDELKLADVPEGGVNVLAGTLTFNYKVGNLSIMPEFRLDKASKDIFRKTDTDSPEATSASVLLAAVYHF